MNDVYLLLGSNLDNRELFLQKAIQNIEDEIAPVIRASSVYETQSWGKTDAPDYLNQVIMLQTDMSAQNILKKNISDRNSFGAKTRGKMGFKNY